MNIELEVRMKAISLAVDLAQKFNGHDYMIEKALADAKEIEEYIFKGTR